MTLEPSPQDRRTASAMAIALSRWHARDPGAVLWRPDGDRWTLTGYSPKARNAHFTDTTGQRRWLRRATFNRWLKGPAP